MEHKFNQFKGIISNTYFGDWPTRSVEDSKLRTAIFSSAVRHPSIDPHPLFPFLPRLSRQHGPVHHLLLRPRVRRPPPVPLLLLPSVHERGREETGGRSLHRLLQGQSGEDHQAGQARECAQGLWQGAGEVSYSVCVGIVEIVEISHKNCILFKMHT